MVRNLLCVDEHDREYIRGQLNFSFYLQAKRIHMHHIKKGHELALLFCLPCLGPFPH